MPDPQPESFELDEKPDTLELHVRTRFIEMGFEPLEAMMLAYAGAHPTEVESQLRRGCPLHLALQIYL